MVGKGCEICGKARFVVLSIVLGMAAGLGVAWAGGGREESMLATFVGAIVPVLWWARRRRSDAGVDSRR